jgi:hypothetical protein
MVTRLELSVLWRKYGCEFPQFPQGLSSLSRGGLDVTRPGIKQEIPVRSPTYNVGATQPLSVRIRYHNSATAHLAGDPIRHWRTARRQFYLMLLTMVLYPAHTVNRITCMCVQFRDPVFPRCFRKG